MKKYIINPLTGRQIQEGGRVYNQLMKEFERQIGGFNSDSEDMETIFWQIYVKLNINPINGGDLYNHVKNYINRCNIPFQMTELSSNNRNSTVEIWFGNLDIEPSQEDLDSIINCLSRLGRITEATISEQVETDDL